MADDTTDSTPPFPAPRALSVERAGARIPAVYWSPRAPARGVVLACHGGSGHKTVQRHAHDRAACVPLGLPFWQSTGPSTASVETMAVWIRLLARQSFRDAWRAGVGRTSMGEDMACGPRALVRMPEYAGLPVGYIGVSMGTAYGLPLLATEPRIRAAAIGLWGTTYAASEHLRRVPQRVRCECGSPSSGTTSSSTGEGTLRSVRRRWLRGQAAGRLPGAAP